MKFIDFKESNLKLAEKQDEYQTLPVFKNPDDKNGEMIYCCKFNLIERIIILFTGKVWNSQLTFNNLFHPVYCWAKNPFKKIKDNADKEDSNASPRL